tara:strand:+ start:60 stop:758 length:699 start_codon:yes stop_codon:yes gene_type:complete
MTNSYKKSYSNEGSDLLVLELLRNIKGKKSYIDIGGNHPKIQNETYLLYKKGWSGLIIEPQIKFNKLYKKYRKKDKIYNGIVAQQKKNYKFYEFSNNRMSTSNNFQLKKNLSFHDRKIISSFDVQSNSLLDILKYFKIDYKNIKYICIDVEGSEYQTLSGINFEFIRPELINIEIKNLGFSDLMNNKIVKKLKELNYYILAKNHLNCFFINKKSSYFDFFPKKFLNKIFNEN